MGLEAGRRIPSGAAEWRRRLAVTLAGVLAAIPLIMANEQPARAADAITCGTTASVFAAASDGTMYLYPLNSPGSSDSTWSTKNAIGQGWGMYGRILGGPSGRIYGINSTGMYRYRWTGSGWESGSGEKISSSFTSYTTNAYRHRITVDERGDFYLIDGYGKLRWYRYDETANSWTISARVIDTGWDRYDLIVAAGVGVLYARDAATGNLYRYRFEPTSQRWIVRNDYLSTGWEVFAKGIFSVGGDTLFGIQTDGDLFQYRYREDNDTWAIHARQIGNAWNFPNVAATTNTCKLTVSHVPARPAAPLQNFTPTQAMQAPSNTLEYAYTDNIGRLMHGRQDPDNFGSVQWTTISGNEAFSGQPALTKDSAGLVQILGRNTDSDIWSRIQASSGSPDWKSWSDLNGRMNSAPAVARLSNNTQVVFALDAAGALWFRQQDGAGGEMLPWRSLGSSGMTGTPTVVAMESGAALVFALNSSGTVRVATYQAGTLSAWKSLGGSGFTGRIATVLMPGYRVRIFATDGTGQVRTQQQDTAGVFPAVWTAVGSGLTVAGSPSALLSPLTGRIGVYVRGGDGSIYYAGETAQGSGVWNNWILAQGGWETYATDPTAFAYNSSNGTVVAYVVRTSDNQHRVYTVYESTAMTASETTRTNAEQVAFVRHDLPAPPHR